MRRPFHARDADELGYTSSTLRTALKNGKLQQVGCAVFVYGSERPTPVEVALGSLIATKGVAIGALAAELHELDAVPAFRTPLVAATGENRRSRVIERDIPSESITNVKGYACLDGLSTVIDLAKRLDDLRWEQALESALFKKLFTVADLEAALVPGMHGIKRIRRVLALRPPGAPPTESILETMMVQLIRRDPQLPTPTRQVVVNDRWDRFVARVDLSWPEREVFLELDGLHHKNQPQYDATRQTAVVAAKRWYVGRFTWDDVVYRPNSTLRRLAELFD